MSRKSQDTTTWTLDRHIAELSVGAMSAKIDLERPELGLQALRVDATSVEGRFLAVAPNENRPSWPAKLVDAYVRGNDVVATYAGVESWPYASQIYWSAEDDATDDATLAALSLVVSIQTNLLDTHPRLFAQSSFATDEVLLVSVVSGHSGDDLLVDSHVDGIQSLDPRSTACGLIWRLPGDKMSYAEVMPLSDFRQLAVVRAGDAVESRWELFAEFLEKGVIRRARLQSLVVPRENDVKLTAECCQSIEKRPLPLTT